ncbi:MAG: large conductance mechanosensitive channel protein MscL [Acidimicrobiia bacterium]
MTDLWSDFKKFLMQGDLVTIAVAFILGGAFKTVVDSLVANVFTPIVGGIFGQTDFSSLTLKIGDVRIAYGAFLNAVISFVIIGATLFVIVKAYEKMKAMRSPEETAADPSEVDLLTEIRDLLQQRTA